MQNPELGRNLEYVRLGFDKYLAIGIPERSEVGLRLKRSWRVLNTPGALVAAQINMIQYANLTVRIPGVLGRSCGAFGRSWVALGVL